MITNYEYSMIGNMVQRLDETNIRLEAVKLFNFAYSRGRLGRFGARIRGRQSHL